MRDNEGLVNSCLKRNPTVAPDRGLTHAEYSGCLPDSRRADFWRSRSRRGNGVHSWFGVRAYTGAVGVVFQVKRAPRLSTAIAGRAVGGEDNAWADHWLAIAFATPG